MTAAEERPRAEAATHATTTPADCSENMHNRRLRRRTNVIERRKKLFVGIRRKESFTFGQRYEDVSVKVSSTFCGLTLELMCRHRHSSGKMPESPIFRERQRQGRAPKN